MDFILSITTARVTKTVHVIGAPAIPWGVEFHPQLVEITYTLDGTAWEVESWTLTGVATKPGRGSRVVTRDGEGEPRTPAPAWMDDLIGKHRPTVTEI